MDRSYTQNDRIALLMALMDVTLEQFHERAANSVELDVILSDDTDPVNEYGGQYFGAMMEADKGDADAPQTMFQAVASMSDETLHRTVRIFGTDPLQEG